MATHEQIIPFPFKTGSDVHLHVNLGSTGKVKADIDLLKKAVEDGSFDDLGASEYDLEEIYLNWYDLIIKGAAVSAANAGANVLLTSGVGLDRNEIRLYINGDPLTDVNVASMDSDVVTASSIKADAITKIATGVWDKDISAYAVVGQAGTYLKGMVASVWSAGTRELTGLGATAIAGIWNAATSGMVTAGSIGKRIVDNLDMVLSTVHTAVTGVKTQTDKVQFDGSNYVKAVPQSAAALSTADKNDIADRVWDELGTGHLNAGSMGLMMHRMKAYAYGKRKLTGGGLVEEIYDEDGATLVSTHALTLDTNGKVTERGART